MRKSSGEMEGCGDTGRSDWARRATRKGKPFGKCSSSPRHEWQAGAAVRTAKQKRAESGAVWPWYALAEALADAAGPALAAFRHGSLLPEVAVFCRQKLSRSGRPVHVDRCLCAPSWFAWPAVISPASMHSCGHLSSSSRDFLSFSTFSCCRLTRKM